MTDAMDFAKVIIVGCGDVGRRVGQYWRRQGLSVHGVVRSADSADLVAASGLEAIIADLDNVWSLRACGGIDRALVYYFAPPTESGVNDLRMRAFISVFRPQRPRHLVLISTTGVYGNCEGAWIDESTPPAPGTDRAARRLDAEKSLAAWGRVCGHPVTVLRVAGIYGRDRLPVRRLRAGTPVVRVEESPYTNRIHVDDLVKACVASARCGLADETYNVCDGNPGTLTQYFLAVADLLNLPPPPQVSLKQARASSSREMRAYLAESRRIRNQKMLRAFKLTLDYPDLASGLRACAPRPDSV